MTETTSTAAGAVLGAAGALPVLVLGAQTDALIIGLFAAMASTAQIGAINSLGRAAAAAFFSSLSAGYGSPLLVPVAGAMAVKFGIALDAEPLRLLGAFVIGAVMPTLWPRLLARAERQVEEGGK